MWNPRSTGLLGHWSDVSGKYSAPVKLLQLLIAAAPTVLRLPRPYTRGPPSSVSPAKLVVAICRLTLPLLHNIIRRFMRDATLPGSGQATDTASDEPARSVWAGAYSRHDFAGLCVAVGRGMVLGAVLYVGGALLWIDYRADRETQWIGFLYAQKELVMDRKSSPGPRIVIVSGSSAACTASTRS